MTIAHSCFGPGMSVTGREAGFFQFYMKKELTVRKTMRKKDSVLFSYYRAF